MNQPITIDKVQFQSGNSSYFANTFSPSALVDLIYPVGSIYISTNSTTPQAIWEQFGVNTTWERITGRFLLGVGSGEETNVKGGSDSVQLTRENLPAHYHMTKGWVYNNVSGTAYDFATYPPNQIGNDPYIQPDWVIMHHVDDNEIFHKVKADDDYKYITNNNNKWEAQRATRIENGATDNGVALLAEPISTLPPYLTVYMWKRTD